MSRHHAFLRNALVLALGLTSHCTARAELLYFAKGGRVQAPATVKGGRVLIATPTGTYEFAERDFARIVPGGCPEREWDARRDSALKAGASARFAAAWWALENGLIPESVSMIRAAHADDPSHQPSARLVSLLDALARPCDDPDTDRLRLALGVSCDVARSPHVLLLHQHDPTEAAARVDLLERVTLAYYLLFTAQGMDLKLPSHRLVSVYLRDHQDYLAFLQSQHAGAFRSTLGYYHPTFGAVIAFDERPPVPPPGTARAPGNRVLDRDSDRRRLLAELERIARDDGTAAHEMVHLLVHESRLCPREGAFPHWLHEGLAAQFEVVRGGRWSGVGRAHDLRLPDWRSLPSPPDLSSLLRDDGFGHGYRRDLYAKCWSLVYYLRKSRSHEFQTFLDLLRLPPLPLDPDDPLRTERLFLSSFGPDLPSTERLWHFSLSDVLTPLEESSPVVPPPGPRFPAERD